MEILKNKRDFISYNEVHYKNDLYDFLLSSIKNEANNGLPNDRGTVAMARTMDPHSATSQFFINHKDNSFLNHTGENPQGWGYAVFGKVTEGMDVVDKIADVATGSSGGHQDVPVDLITIESVTVSE